jgi:hypothetical protein
MRYFPEIYRLPSALATGAGKYIARFSYLEYVLTKVVYDLIGIDEKAGRLTIKISPKKYAALLSKLLKLRSITTQVNIKHLGTEIFDTYEIRNLLAHGVWTRHPDYPKDKRNYIIEDEGAWSEPGHPIDSTSRAIKPEAINISTAYLSNWRIRIDAAIKLATKLKADVTRELAKQKKQQQKSSRGKPA